VSKDDRSNKMAIEEVARLARALNHPTRLLILARLANGPTSASDIAKSYGTSVSLVSYHLRVLYEDCELAEIVDTREVRGAREYVFGLRDAEPDRFIADCVAALHCEVAYQRREELFSMTSLRADAHGWKEVRAALKKVQDTIKRVQDRAQVRASDRDCFSIVVGIGAAAIDLRSDE
jgi:DNA-binding transcriptional ArsR family regulator